MTLNGVMAVILPYLSEFGYLPGVGTASKFTFAISSADEFLSAYVLYVENILCGKALCYHSLTGNRTIYDHEILDVHGRQPLDWSTYYGRVVLLVNVASF